MNSYFLLLGWRHLQAQGPISTFSGVGTMWFYLTVHHSLESPD